MTDEDLAEKGERIAKVIARAGVCSRREAERLIAQGRVELDGEDVIEPGTLVRPGQRVSVDGEPLASAEAARLFRLHKPVGVLTTSDDPEGRPTIYNLIPTTLPRLMPVGRLDLNSEGLLLLTNDGGLKRRLEHPSTAWVRRYRVRVYGDVDEAALAALSKGLTLEGERLAPIAAALDIRTGRNAWLTFALKEGKNREIRRICTHLGLQVSRLLRTSFGPFQLGALKEGQLEEIPQKVLREQLGSFLTDKAAQPAGKTHAHRRRQA